MVSPLETAVSFLKEFGFFDIVLPFLLVFTIVFAILEKTAVFGWEDEDKKIPKKNINAMVAFVIGFMVVAATKVVEVLNKALPQVILILILLVAFLMLVGSLMKPGGLDLSSDQAKGWKVFFMIVILIALVLIFLNALGWIDWAFSWVTSNWTGPIFGTIIIFIIIILAIVWVSRGQGGGNNDDSEGES